MLSRERTIDCMMHRLLGDDTIYQELGMMWRRDNSSPSGRIYSAEGRPIKERQRILMARFKEVAMRWNVPVAFQPICSSIWLVKLQGRVKRVDSFVCDKFKSTRGK